MYCENLTSHGAGKLWYFTVLQPPLGQSADLPSNSSLPQLLYTTSTGLSNQPQPVCTETTGISSQPHMSHIPYVHSTESHTLIPVSQVPCVLPTNLPRLSQGSVSRTAKDSQTPRDSKVETAYYCPECPYAAKRECNLLRHMCMCHRKFK
ncbi:uncharacterized protein LOC126475305 isoform X1 [Schistocerca serialis cubense]|uniref:uncharacterized protein LOC126475305 isoform X1 n=1 Tax=Schistocerca serialis cubense TaxID=2023355 RepID=UPI00214EE829|nr:uncharacterized protein LOC126475305 isoform X1 [Schistocerca serialis cubense]